MTADMDPSLFNTLPELSRNEPIGRLVRSLVIYLFSMADGDAREECDARANIGKCSTVVA
jgi:hypothetical protein